MGEAVGVAIDVLEEEKDPKCDKKDKDKGWKSRVNKFNSQEKCTGGRLYDNMKAEAPAHEKKGLGFVPPKKAGTKWKLALVSSKFFPIQAHHLIPKSFLPNHRVCTWLAIKYTKNPKYELKYDSNYDTDRADNGYCMPYASPLAEWGGNRSKKTAAAFQVMERVGIQLHQGSHAAVLDAKKLDQLAGKPIMPEITDIAGDGDSDEYEDSGIHEPGYLNKVGVLLNVVDAKSLSQNTRATDGRRGRSHAPCLGHRQGFDRWQCGACERIRLLLCHPQGRHRRGGWRGVRSRHEGSAEEEPHVLKAPEVRHVLST